MQFLLRLANGKIINNALERTDLIQIEDIDVFRSPYLDGVFSPLLGKDLRWQAILETNRGCPFLCTYCFWGRGGINRKIKFFSLERIKQEIDWCGKHRVLYVFVPMVILECLTAIWRFPIPCANQTKYGVSGKIPC